MAVRPLDDIPVAILAGGTATRLGDIAQATPKALVDVAGRPFIAHQLTLLRRRGFGRIVLCVGHLGDQIASVVGDGRDFDLTVTYAHDGPVLMGTAGALRAAAPRLGAQFWVLYGDSYLDIDYEAVQAAFDAAPRESLMTIVRNDNRWDRSNVEFADGVLRRYDKRQPTPAMHHIDFGASILTATALTRVPAGVPSDLADLYASLVADGAMGGYEVQERFYEVGSPAGLDDTRRYFEQRQSQP